MGGGGHGHAPPYKIPDYRIYKVENVPDLVRVQRVLASEGLKDPWLRNEVWKYGTWSRRDIVTKGIFRGCGYGFVAAIFTTALTFYFDYQEKQHGHGGGH